MKNECITIISARSAKSGMVAAAALAFAYWVSQIAATYYVSELEILRTSSGDVAALCFGLFGALFILHLFRPWSKAAAIFGLLSFAVYVALMWYNTRPSIPGFYGGLIDFLLRANTGMVISSVLGISGVALDANRCRHLVQKA